MNVSVSALLLLLVPCAALSAQPDTEFLEDFRNKKIEDLQVKPSRADTVNFLKSEPQGLRLTLPPGPRPHGEQGVIPRFHLQGDFDISAGYEILKVDPPDAGRGISFEIYLQTKTPTVEALTFTRIINPDGSGVYWINRLTTNAQGKRAWPPGLNVKYPDDLPSGKTGHLRIRRLGADTILSAAEPAGNAYRDLFRVPLGTEDVIKIRVGMNAGGAASLVDVRLLEVRLRGTLIPTEPGSNHGPMAPRNRTLWWLAALFAAAMVIGGLWIWWRKARANAEAATPQEP